MSLLAHVKTFERYPLIMSARRRGERMSFAPAVSGKKAKNIDKTIRNL
jgi:hypothetical protein